MAFSASRSLSEKSHERLLRRRSLLRVANAIAAPPPRSLRAVTISPLEGGGGDHYRYDAADMAYFTPATKPYNRYAS